jgi:hypothetical protein
MKNFDENKKSSKRNHIKNKSHNKDFYDDEFSYQKKASKEFKQKKQMLDENEDWENWEDYK